MVASGGFDCSWRNNHTFSCHTCIKYVHERNVNQFLYLLFKKCSDGVFLSSIHALVVKERTFYWKGLNETTHLKLAQFILGMNVINVRKIPSREVNSVFKQIVRQDKVGLEAHVKDGLMDKIN